MLFLNRKITTVELKALEQNEQIEFIIYYEN